MSQRELRIKRRTAVVKAIHIPDDLLRELKSSAAIDGRTMREAAAIAIRNYINQRIATQNRKLA
jgi:hypothetical protein